MRLNQIKAHSLSYLPMLLVSRSESDLDRSYKLRHRAAMVVVRLGLALVLCGSVATAQLNQDPMRDKEIAAFLAGNTIGAHDWGVADSYEYHSAEGEAIWREGDQLNIGIYRIKNGQVCYAYEGQIFNDWFCWDFRRDRRSRDVYQHNPSGSYYRLYIVGEGDLVSTNKATSGK